MRCSSRNVGVLLVTLLSPIWASCGNPTPLPTRPTPTTEPATPTTSPAPPPPVPIATATRVSINGNFALSTIGETTQLTATATLSDGSTKDVTGDGKWTSGDTRVIAVSPTGLMTVVGFGASSISFVYQTRFAGTTATATPAGTFVILGGVREPGEGPILGVRVVDVTSGRSVVTDSSGQFSMAELRSPQAHVKGEKDGYEPAEGDATGARIDLPMQHVVRLTVGDTVKPAVLAPHDLSYTVGGRRCDDCRLIRVAVPQPGIVQVHVTWGNTASNLSLFAEGQVVEGGARELTADVPIAAPREVLMYLGMTPPGSVSSHTAFTFERSLK
jgi:hypothetical protein